MPVVSDTTKVPERFSLLGENEPTDEQLEGLLRGMRVDVVQTRARLARQKLMENLQRDTDEARARMACRRCGYSEHECAAPSPDRNCRAERLG